MLRYGDIIDINLWKQDRNKADRPHRLRLPPLAIDLVGTGEANGFVFEGDPGKAISGFSKFKRALDKASGISGWRLHDLRRSAASSMQELGVSHDVVQGVLNHAIGGVGGVYLRAEMEKAKATALVAWAAEIERVVGARRAAS